jgi:hypothetical protein
MKTTLEKMMACDFVEDFYIEDDTAAMAYMQQLEYQQWYNEVGWIDEVNAELQEIVDSEREFNVSECLLTNEDLARILSIGA